MQRFERFDDRFFVDLHLHDERSLDAKRNTVSKVINRIREQGMGAVAITNHHTFSSTDQKRYRHETDAIMISGVELYMRIAGERRMPHLLVLANRSGIIRGLVEEFSFPLKLPTLEDVRDYVKQYDREQSLVIVPHPVVKMKKKAFHSFTLDEVHQMNKNSNFVSAIEIKNGGEMEDGRWSEKILNLQRQRCDLAREMGIAGVYNSDAHRPREMGRVFSVVNEKVSNSGEIIMAVKERLISEGQMGVGKDGDVLYK